MRTIRIGTRGSKLALTQTTLVRQALEKAYPGRDFEVRIIKTTGDILADAPLEAIGGKGVFVKELEGRLLSGEIDLAVHSLKDMQSTNPVGLGIAAFLEREDPRDMLFTREGSSLENLPERARVGTSSLRRICQLKALRPDVTCVPIRGNVPTRLAKIGPELEAVILAAAGVKRLGLAPGKPIDAATMIPSPGQAVIAVEVRTNDQEVIGLAQGLDHEPTRRCALAERAFLATLGADCRIPAGAYAVIEDGRLCMVAMIGNNDGTRIERMTRYGDSADIGRLVAEELLDRFYGEKR